MRIGGQKIGRSDEAARSADDAEAICEAVTRPSMRFVEVKTPEQQVAKRVYEKTEYRLPMALKVGDQVQILSAGTYTASYARHPLHQRRINRQLMWPWSKSPPRTSWPRPACCGPISI